MPRIRKKRRSGSQLAIKEERASRVIQRCVQCGHEHLCSGVPAPSNKPIPRLRIGVSDDYVCTCKVCKRKYQHPTIAVPGESEPLVLPGFSCESSNLIYAFFCTHPECKKVKYVGSTSQTLGARMRTHTSAGNALVRAHELSHPESTQLVILEAWTNGADLPSVLKERECHWTNKFSTLQNHGNGGLQKSKPHGKSCTSC